SGAAARLGVAGFAPWLARPLLVAPDLRPRPFIVVLCGGCRFSGELSESTCARVEHGVGLFRHGLAPRPILSGGRWAPHRPASATRRSWPRRSCTSTSASRTTARSGGSSVLRPKMCRHSAGRNRGPSPRDTLTRNGGAALDGATRRRFAAPVTRRSNGPAGRPPGPARRRDV